MPSATASRRWPDRGLGQRAGSAVRPVVCRGPAVPLSHASTEEVGWFPWPLWRVALSAAVARNLIQSAPRDPMIPDTYISAARAWGVHRLMRSRITRSDPGGLGRSDQPCSYGPTPHHHSRSSCHNDRNHGRRRPGHRGGLANRGPPGCTDAASAVLPGHPRVSTLAPTSDAVLRSLTTPQRTHGSTVASALANPSMPAGHNRQIPKLSPR